MNLIYLLVSTAVFVFLPTNIAERLKPGDPYLFVVLIIIAKAFFDERQRFLSFLFKIKTPALIVLASYFISAAFSAYTSDSLKFTIRFIILILFAPAVASLFKKHPEPVIYLKALFFFGIITAVHAAYQIVNPPPVIQGLSSIEGLSNVRVFATFFNANIYAEFLVIIATIGLGLVFYEQKNWKKAAYTLFTVFILFILFYTYSRGSLLGVVVSYALFFLLTYPRLFIPFSAAGILLAAFIPGFLIRLYNTITFKDSSQFLRLRIWHTAFSTIDSPRKLLIGTGPYSFKYEMMDYVRQSADRFFGYFSFQPHNIYLLWLVEGGLLMLLAWLYFFAFILSKGFSACNTLKSGSKKDRFIAAALVSALSGLLINGLTETIFYHNQVLPFLFLLVGIILYLDDKNQSG